MFLLPDAHNPKQSHANVPTRRALILGVAAAELAFMLHPTRLCILALLSTSARCLTFVAAEFPAVEQAWISARTRKIEATARDQFTTVVLEIRVTLEMHFLLTPTLAPAQSATDIPPWRTLKFAVTAAKFVSNLATTLFLILTLFIALAVSFELPTTTLL